MKFQKFLILKLCCHKLVHAEYKDMKIELALV